MLDLGDMAVEAPALVAERIRRTLPYLAPEPLIVAAVEPLRKGHEISVGHLH